MDNFANAKLDRTKVSVIIPCYNCERFIDETLMSIYNQTYKNIEVVCINDGSSDKTLSIIESWKRKGLFEMIIYNQNNAGVSASRNKGIDLSTGGNIVFLDADDKISPLFIELLTGAIERNDVSYCKITRNESDIENNMKKAPILESDIVAMRKLMYTPREYGFSTFMYKKDLLMSHQIYFDTNTRHGEDREFLWKYLSYCKSASFVNEKMYFYRSNANSATNQNITWELTEAMNAHNRVSKVLGQQNSLIKEEYDGYMYSRSVWSFAKTFAVANKKELFLRLRKEYNVASCMRILVNSKEKSVAISSIAYLVSPMLFYYVLSMIKYVNHFKRIVLNCFRGVAV